MDIRSINQKARQLYPCGAYARTLSVTQQAYVKGYLDAMQEKAGVSKEFFTELAEKLRELWPAGEKDGKYPWRDSVDNLSKRLESLWTLRELKGYTIDDCLIAARRYLSQFETNAKYMQTLKYFILKQSQVVQKDGLIKYISESKFADYLTDSTTQALQNEWADAFSSISDLEEGEIL